MDDEGHPLFIFLVSYLFAVSSSRNPLPTDFKYIRILYFDELFLLNLAAALF